MSTVRIAELARRGVVAVGGADAEKFLDDLVTSDVPKTAGGAAYGGLLTPQGKVLFDFIVFRDGDRFLFDLPRASVPDFVKRLTFYRLRAKVDVTELADRRVIAAWDGDAPMAEGTIAPDPRLAALGWRAVVTGTVAATATEMEYDAHRVGFGVPEGGIDFAFGDSFPHDADMDQLGGVDFAKGCYVGQEVVSRMEHRGTARRRFILAKGSQPLPPAGAPVMAGERNIGTLGSSAGENGLALVRLDRAKDAIDRGMALTSGGAAVTLTLPTWARFGWPASVTED